VDQQLTSEANLMCRSPNKIHDAARTRPGAFTLVEMLVVVAVIAILTALTLPALQGLVGASGVRGGVSLVMTTMDQARTAAIKEGTDVYVGFPPLEAGDAAFSSLIVFRSLLPDETGYPSYKPLSRWMRMPSGVFLDSSQITETLPTSPGGVIPKLDGGQVNPRVVRFDRFGRMRNVTGTNTLTIGEAIVVGQNIQFKGPEGGLDVLTAQPLTGRWIAKRP